MESNQANLRKANRTNTKSNKRFTKQIMVSIAEYEALAKPKRKQIEGRQQVRFGSFLRTSKFSNNLIFFTYSASGEKKPMRTAVNQKRKGLQRGEPDYRFEIKDGNSMRLVYIEFKSTKGSLSSEQKQFFANHEGLGNVKCYIARSADEAVRILEQEKIYQFKN